MYVTEVIYCLSICTIKRVCFHYKFLNDILLFIPLLESLEILYDGKDCRSDSDSGPYHRGGLCGEVPHQSTGGRMDSPRYYPDASPALRLPVFCRSFAHNQSESPAILPVHA